MASQPKLSQEDWEDLARRDILSYGILHVDLLQNREWEVGNRTWMPQIYQVVNPRDIENSPQGRARTLSIQKSTQCGMSTMAMVRMFHFADFWSVRLMYMLPRQQDYIDFVTTRIDPTIAASDRLRNMLGTPDSTRAKQIGNSYLFFMESTVEPRMMPANAIFVDEIDLSNMTNVSTLENRMDDPGNPWKLKFYFSTPTLPNFGVNALYETSDKRQWFVACPKCEKYQTLDWDKQLRVVGPRNDPEHVFFGCVYCNEPLTHTAIQSGQWVPEYPDRSGKHIGFHISQMMTHTPWELYQHFIDPKTKLYEFYRKRLGKPYELGIGSLEREDVLAACFDLPYDYEDVHDGKSSYFMGVDQGNELQVLIAKKEPKNPKPKIVFMELIPYDEGGFDRVGRLMHLFNISKAVIDADPNQHSARDLQKEFPGRLLLAHYSEQRTDWKTKKNTKTGITDSVVIGRSEAFDSLVEDIKSRNWLLPGMLPKLSPDTELIIDHVTALRRDLETRRSPSGEREVPVWRELRPSHLAHAWVYLKTAIEILRGKDYRIAEVGKDKGAPAKSADNTTAPHITRITYHLAEVPLAQLKAYVDSSEESKMPMKHKLKLARAEGFGEKEIKEAAAFLIRDKEAQL